MIRKLYSYFKIYGPKRFLENMVGELKMLKRGPLYNSYSQNSEDILIDRLLGNKKTGFYVDVGAYDPSRLSNTKRFYKRGWSGINIETDPRKIIKFHKLRTRDLNLNVGIANKNGRLWYFEFEPDTLSTFSKQAAENYKRQGYKLVGTFKIPVLKLGGVLEKYSKSKRIDFISVDVEGYDLEVLKSNNWKMFKPRLICVEADESSEKNIDKFLARIGYKMVCRNHNNLIFLLKKR